MIWPGPGVLPGGSNSSPVAMIATSGRRNDRQRGVVRGSRQRQRRGIEHALALEQRFAFFEIEAGAADVAAGGDRLDDLDGRRVDAAAHSPG